MSNGGEEIIYQRGHYKLCWIRNPQGKLRTTVPQIVWYDRATKRTRRKSADTSDIAAAELALDALYEKNERGRNVCPACGSVKGETSYLVTEAIAAYALARETRRSGASIKSRLAQFVDFQSETDQLDLTCDQVSPEIIEAFREWASEVPVIHHSVTRERSPSTIEGTVRSLKAAVNFAHANRQTPFPANFTPLKPSQTDRSPTYRASTDMLAKMFRHCTDPAADNPKNRKRLIAKRRNLLHYLQAAVATWARPEAVFDISTDREREQWHAEHQALNLNPRGRAQTKKYRPVVPVARQLVPLLNANTGFFVEAITVRTAWLGMAESIGMPKEHGGMKLIRRSIATLARRRLGERDWIEGQIMLGHRQASKISDIYAPFEPDYLRRALEVTEEIIDEIINLAPRAFMLDENLDSHSIHESEQKTDQVLDYTALYV